MGNEWINMKDDFDTCIIGKYFSVDVKYYKTNKKQIKININSIQRDIIIFKYPPIRHLSASSLASYCIKVCLSLMKHMHFVK